MNIRLTLLLLLAISLVSNSSAATQESEEPSAIKNVLYHVAAKTYPREKVYLHLDNTSYYRGDDIWFKAYIVNSDMNRPSDVSGTLYVELLNPGGEIIDRQVLKVTDGQADGNFRLSRVPFYSGFYEIRAYTKYMMNFGDDEMYTRVIPVFDAPKKEGDYASRQMMKYGAGKFEYKRPSPVKNNGVNMRFYPEGGHLVSRLPSKVAFEVTDGKGMPMDVTGKVVDNEGNVLTTFGTAHEGKGVFTVTPDRGETRVIISCDGKEHTFKLPEAQPQGFVMSVDNLSLPDSIGVTIARRGKVQRDTLGVALLSRGILKDYSIVTSLFTRPLHLTLDRSLLSPGVNQVVLFDREGNAICDRLIFTHGTERLDVTASYDKPSYRPFEPVVLSVHLSEKGNEAVTAPFSLAVRDGSDEVAWGRNILTDLLLMSEIKGYVANPAYYFETDDAKHREHLDLLLMVQGWRRYSWDALSGVKPFTPRYHAERSGIETAGTVTTLFRGKPKSGVDVTAFMLRQNEDDEQKASAINVLTTDSLGQFSFYADVEGEWNLILSTREKGKKKNYLITLDRMFSPKPQPYRQEDMTINLIKDDDASIHAASIGSTDEASVATIDSDKPVYGEAETNDRVKQLDELVVKGKNNSRESIIRDARSASLAYYDVQSGLDDIRDEGGFIGDDLHEFLIKMNYNFTRTYSVEGEEFLLYKGRNPMIVIDYERSDDDSIRYKHLRLNTIKSIYVSEDPNSINSFCQAAMIGADSLRNFSCIVFIETYPDGKTPADADKGVRKTRLHGYSVPAEFYNPDYSYRSATDTDYRRTIYWNPNVKPDMNGDATVRFYNNGSARRFVTDLQTVTPTGAIGVSDMSNGPQNGTGISKQ